MVLKWLALSLIALAVLSTASNADSPHVAASLINGGQQSDGAYTGALKLELNEGWITYWRVPGEAGVAPVFSTQGSENIKALEVTYPSPHLHEAQGLRSLAYMNKVILPMHIVPIDAAKPVLLKLHVDYAVCHDLCLPEQADFEQHLEKTKDEAVIHQIEAAQANIPQDNARLVSGSVFTPENEGGALDVTFTSKLPWQVAVLETDARHAILSRGFSGMTAHFVLKKTPLPKSILRLTLIGEKTAATTQFEFPAPQK